MATLKENFEYFLAHKQELLAEHSGKYVAIAECAVQGSFNNEVEAVEQTKRRFPLGTFLIQKVEPGDAAYSQTYRSRVAFTA